MENKIRLIAATATIEALAANFRQDSVDGCDNPFYQIAEDTIEEMPTLTDHFPDTTKMVPLTLEQLREIEKATPVWWEGAGFWCLSQNGGIVTPFGQCYDVEGVPGKFYAYFPAHIDREAWGECAYCSSILHMEGVEMQPCASGYIGCEVSFGKFWDDEKVGMVVYYRNAAAGYVDFDFCPFCGKPQTETAWSKLEKRISGGEN